MSEFRIGYTCHDVFPSTDTNTQQIFWTLYEVARLGHRVDLRVRGLPHTPDARERIAAHYGVPDGKLPECFAIVGADDRGPKWAMAPNVAAFDIRAPRAFAPATHDVVWTRDPLALVSAMRSGVPAVFETFRPDFAQAAAFAPWRWLTIAHARPRFDIGRLAGVITHSQLTATAFIRAGVPPARCTVAHNGYAPVLMGPPLTTSEARRRVGLPEGRPLLVYTGHVGPHKGTDELIALASAVPEVSIVIVGVEDDSPERRWLDARVRDASVGNVLLVPRVGLREVATYLYAADGLLVPSTAEPLLRYGRTVLPMKVFSYLAAGRPILGPRLPDIEEVLCDNDTALLVPPDDSAAAAGAVRRLLADPGLAARLGSAARERAREYTWQARAQKIVEALSAWVSRGPYTPSEAT